uniref:Uncharacterized protein n=1 Tax=Peromyscus maniculatus bairdii TaxID=230844 RepID=A0A8C8UMC9_PERMB
VGKAEVQDLVGVLLQCLHLHTGYHVIEPSELLIPGRGRCGQYGVTPACKPPLLIKTKKLIPGHSLPLAAHQPSSQHICRVQAQEDLVDQAVGEQGHAPLVHRDILPRHDGPSLVGVELTWPGSRPLNLCLVFCGSGWAEPGP